MQDENLVIGGARTDVKGDRSLSPSQQEDPDLFTYLKEGPKWYLHIRCKGTPNWMYKFTLDIGDAYNEIEGRGQTLCYSRCNSCRCKGYHVYLW